MSHLVSRWEGGSPGLSSLFPDPGGTSGGHDGSGGDKGSHHALWDSDSTVESFGGYVGSLLGISEEPNPFLPAAWASKCTEHLTVFMSFNIIFDVMNIFCVFACREKPSMRRLLPYVNLNIRYPGETGTVDEVLEEASQAYLYA